MKRVARRSDCPISFALDIFGDRWSLLIVRDIMFKGKVSYGEFLHSEEQVATNTLADRLALLEGAGIVRRSANSQDKRSDIYSLTRQGADLAPMLVEMVLWSAKYDPRTAADRRFVLQAKRNRAQLIKSITGVRAAAGEGRVRRGRRETSRSLL
jgi:DNA-binding HxlR family transcriptional regulator